MLWYNAAEKMIAIAIPLASFAAMVVGIFLYAKTKGQKDAMQSTIDTYKGLAEARRAKIAELELEKKELEEETQKLRYGINTQKEVMCTAIDELVAGFHRAGRNVKKPKIEFCEEGEEL